jgi:TATA-box binding protein (TBP) (component of TFIID and TFIIIB)
MYANIVICKADAVKCGTQLNILHHQTYIPPDPQISLLELESQNVVFIITFPPMRDIRGMQALASTSTLSPFPDLGTRTWEGTLLTYGSGRVVCTGHKTVADAIMNINALARAFSYELQQPITILKGELTNLVASGRIAFPLSRSKLRTMPNARFTPKFDGTTFDARRETGKNMRLSLFRSGRFNVPGVKNLEEAKRALVQNLGIITMCREIGSTVATQLNPRNTTRKRRRIREW